MKSTNVISDVLRYPRPTTLLKTSHNEVSCIPLLIWTNVPSSSKFKVETSSRTHKSVTNLQYRNYYGPILILSNALMSTALALLDYKISCLPLLVLNSASECQKIKVHRSHLGHMFISCTNERGTSRLSPIEIPCFPLLTLNHAVSCQSCKCINFISVA